MNVIVSFIAAALFFFASLPAHAFPPKLGGDCLHCHKLDKKEAEDIIKPITPPGTTLTVLDIKLAPVKAFWQIDVKTNDGRRGSVYLDFTRKYFAPTLSPVPTKVDLSKIPLQDAVVLGSKTAPKKVVVFTDPDCPACRQLHGVMKQVIEKRKDIAFYLFLYPLPIHKEDAYKKAQAILCEKSLDLLDEAYAGKPLPEPKCSNEQLEKNLALGRSIPIEATPTIIREDGMRYLGPRQADAMILWIDEK
jgi:thiol:disulfide interchange protein DsbC